MLAVVRLDDGPCTREEAEAKGWGLSPWFLGKYGYHIAEVHKLTEPVGPITGQLGLMRMDHGKRTALTPHS